MGVSLKPSEATSGGLLDDADVHIDSARYEIFDYQGKSDPAPALVLHCTLEDGDEHTEVLSVGKASDWEPSDDGKELIPIGNATTLRTTCKAMHFLTSLVNAGFDEELLDEDPSVLDGLGVHVMRTPVEYKGLEKRKDSEGREQEFTALTVSEINYLPGEGGKGKGKGKAAGGKGKAAGTGAKGKAANKSAASGGKGKAGGKAGAKSETADSGDSDLDDAAEQALMAVLLENDGSIESRQIPTKAYQHLSDVANRNAVLKRCYAEDFLNQEGKPWTFEDGVVKLEE
jgi:hypothetical protein